MKHDPAFDLTKDTLYLGSWASFRVDIVRNVKSINRIIYQDSTALFGKWASDIENALQWRHNGRDGVSNHQPHDCLLNRLFNNTLTRAMLLHFDK